LVIAVVQLHPSTAAVSAAFGVDALKQLAAQPTPRLDRSPWQGFVTATDASASIELGFGESAGNLPDGRGRLSRCAEAQRLFVTRVGKR
jgi:hypothetical protein